MWLHLQEQEHSPTALVPRGKAMNPALLVLLRGLGHILEKVLYERCSRPMARMERGLKLCQMSNDGKSLQQETTREQW